MTQVFVANATHQIHEFMYRVPESPKLIVQRIPPGGQIRLAARRGDLSPTDVESIFEQHRKYGMIRSDDVGRSPGYCPLVVGLDKVVSYERLLEQLRLNRMQLVAQGKSARESAAVALNQQIEENIAMSGMQDVLREVEFSVEEERRTTVLDRTARGDDQLTRELADTPPIAEGIRVRAGAEEPADRVQARPSGRRARAPRQKK